MTNRKPRCTEQADATAFELTVFTKSDGPLTKRITLAPDGKLTSDANDCIMSRGNARRTKVHSVGQLADLIEGIGSDQALALGALRTGLPDQVEIVTKAKINGSARPDIIARVASNINYQLGQPAFMLLDFDTKGMPPEVADQIERGGGFWPTLLSLFPALREVAHVTRSSTSAGLFRSDTGDKLPGSRGLHCYLAVKDGADVERFLKVLHDRCWLAGFGWMMVGAGGQMLERALIDRSVFGAERLVFEGPPILKPPLQQDRKSRRPVATDGDLLDTGKDFPPLTIVETAELDKLRAKAKYQLATEATKARDAFIKVQAERIVKKTGMSSHAAKRVASRHCNGILLPSVELPFDDPEFAGCTTVADVLADPDKFEGATLADPLEGIAYGTCKAKILLHPNGTPWIHSFAHGRTTYHLNLDANAVLAAMQKADAGEVVRVFVGLAAAAALDDEDIEELIDEAVRRSGVKINTVKAMLKKRRQGHAAEQAEQDRQRNAAQRPDPRPQIHNPDADAPWTPVMDILNGVLGASTTNKPPSRNIDGCVTRARRMVVPQTHAFTSESEAEAEADVKLPTPEQWVLSKLNEMELAEMIEASIDFINGKGRSVHLPTPFVKHYLQRDDHVLPTVSAIAVAPIVSADGGLLAPEGLDRERGIIFEIPKEVRAILPRREDCTDKAVKDAMRFLCDDWLCDVNTADFSGKAIIVAAALTLIERSLLPERPTFVTTAGRRSSGKTTTIKMLIMALLGVQAAAAAWSSNEEERRKTITALLLSGKDQAAIAFRYIRAFFEDVPTLRAMVKNISSDSIELTNKVVIQVIVNSYRSIRGRSVLAAIVDEAAFWRSDESQNPDAEVHAALAPSLARVKGSMLVMISSAHRCAGLLYDKWKACYGQPDDDVLVARGTTTQFNPSFDHRVIDKALALDPQRYAAEYNSAWRDDLATFLSRDLLDAAVEPGVVVRRPISEVSYCAFADPSGGRGDAFTMSVAHRDSGSRVVVDLIYERRPPFNPSEVIDDISKLLKSYRCSAVTGDRYAAEFVVEAFRKCGIRYIASKLDRSEVYIDFLPLISSGQVQLLDHVRAIAQFAALERRTFPSGKDRIDHPLNGHDDLANAIAGAAVLASADREQAIPLVAPIIVSQNMPPSPGMSTTAAFYASGRYRFN
jgi:hypothetical protein